MAVDPSAAAAVQASPLIVRLAAEELPTGCSLQLQTSGQGGGPVTWSSSNPAAAQVNAATGALTCLSVGRTWIRAVGGSARDSINVRVRARWAITLSPTALSMMSGATSRVGSNVPGTWTSADTLAARVSATGAVIAGRAGTTTLTFTTLFDGSAMVIVKVRPSPVARVTVSPASVTVMVGGTQQLAAVALDAGNRPVAGLPTFYATNAAQVATVSTTGVVYGVKSGMASVTASIGGVSANVPVMVNAYAPSATRADPLSLPDAKRQDKNVAAYAALNVPRLPAGASYLDPVSGLRVWKMTSATVPAANAYMHHNYSEGPSQISREYGGKHTIWIDGMAGGVIFVDFKRGVGFSNYRSAPGGTSSATFSKDPPTPSIVYLVSGTGQMRRYDVATNAYADVAPFPVSLGGASWFQNDRNDERFAVLSGTVSGGVTVYTRSTNSSVTKAFAGLDEPYLERNGNYVLANNSLSAPQLWDLATNTTVTLPAPGNSSFGHAGILRGYFVISDVNTGKTTPQWAVDPSPARAHVSYGNLGGYYPDAHSSGLWVMSDAELGGNLKKQWVLRESYDFGFVAYGSDGVKEGLAMLTLDGLNFKLVAHHYSVRPTSTDQNFNYYSQPRTCIGTDGKLVMFTSNMNGSPRTDVFVIEMPVK